MYGLKPIDGHNFLATFDEEGESLVRARQNSEWPLVGVLQRRSVSIHPDKHVGNSVERRCVGCLRGGVVSGEAEDGRL